MLFVEMVRNELASSVVPQVPTRAQLWRRLPDSLPRSAIRPGAIYLTPGSWAARPYTMFCECVASCLVVVVVVAGLLSTAGEPTGCQGRRGRRCCARPSNFCPRWSPVRWGGGCTLPQGHVNLKIAPRFLSILQSNSTGTTVLVNNNNYNNAT